ncbi:ATP-binding protein [Paenibacillus cymbidii]|uniref:ATP-binding protein n=1 Tax=Paenibacillus cymbidii TaxID=1639034 RepID=UPI00108000D0|nr:ATP-binding protein [Paenibacillus cymbidii]
MTDAARLTGLSALLDDASTPAALFQPDTAATLLCMWANRSFAAMIGSNASTAIGRSPRELFPKGQADLVLESLQAAQTRRQPIRQRFHTAADRQQPYEIAVEPLEGNDGRVCLLVLFHPSPLAERSAPGGDASERSYKKLVEQFPDSVLIVEDDIISFANPACASLLAATTTDQIVGRSLFDFILPMQHPELRHRLRALRGDKEPLLGFETSIIRFDGTPRIAELSGFVSEGSRNRALQLMIRDVTEQRTTQEEHNRFFTMTLDLLAVYDFDGKVVALNPAWTNKFGFSLEELSQRKFAAIVHPDDVQAGQTAALLLGKGVPIVNLELRHLTAGGEYRLIRWSSSALTEHKKIYAIGTDITEMREQQDLLQKSEKLSIVGQLAAGLAHEIRNPLTSLKGFLQLFRKRFGHDPSYADYFRIMDTEFVRIEEIVNEFLILAKPQPRNFQPHDMSELVPDIVKLLEPQALLGSVEMTVDIEPDLAPVNCDENQLKQVFVNLIKNGIEAMPQGGSLNVKVTRRSEDYIAVTVADQGQGIPQEQLNRLGEPFMTTKVNGTGLGLMICYKIMEAHQGRLHFESRLGQGTTAEVLLPIAHETTS